MLSHAEFTSFDKRSISVAEDVFVFDLAALVPGTCCQIDHDFAVYLRTFANARQCYLLTSVSYNELMARLPTSVRKAFKGSLLLPEPSTGAPTRWSSVWSIRSQMISTNTS